MIIAALTMLRSGNAWMFAAVFGLVVGVASCDRLRIHRAEKRGGAEVVANVNEQAKEKTDAARKARLPAAQPGAAQRLLKRDHCRDC